MTEMMVSQDDSEKMKEGKVITRLLDVIDGENIANSSRLKREGHNNQTRDL